MNKCALLAVVVGVGAIVFRAVFHVEDFASTPIDLVRPYDYIVVGAGSAGSVVASRLSENPAVRVLLLEAGPSEAVSSVSIPAACPLIQNTARDWAYRTVPQTHSSFAFRDAQSHWPRGKMLGGSSSMNYMVYVRGARQDFESWGPGWSYEDVLPFFLKSEGNRAHNASRFHNTEGELTISKPVEPNPLVDAFIAAGVELGLAENNDYNGESILGIGKCDLTIKDGERASTASAFLRRQAAERSNLVIRTGAFVRRLILDGDRAVAVEFEDSSGMHRVHARREIVLSAGTIGSAHLLLLSGIGPGDQLRAAGVTPLVESPHVGANLQDHIMAPIRFVLRPNASQHVITESDARSLVTLIRYVTRRRGLLTTNGLEGTAFLRTGMRDALDGLASPDLQLHFLAASTTEQDLLNIGFNRSFIDSDAMRAPDWAFAVHCLPILLHPRSRGSVTLVSADPHVHPAIDPRYLTDDHDVATLVEGLAWCERLAATKAFAPFLHAEPALPRSVMAAARRNGSRASPFAHVADDREWLVRHFASTVYHPVGTCAIGSVVDANLRVMGVRGLRVADLSVAPSLTSGNTNAPAIMIGERAAALLAASKD